MATPATMRQLEDRQVDRAVIKMLWSPKMDILVVVFETNDISLFRLNWQRIWITDAREQKCTSLAWRPDGKVLAVGYSDGKIELYDVESNVPVLTNQTNGEVSFMRWSSCENSIALNSGRDSNVNLDKNLDWDFLVQFPLLSKAFSYNPSNQDDFQTCRKLSLESCPSILICGTSKGYVSFYMSGYMAIGHINIGNLYSISSCVVKDVIFSPKSMSTLSVMASEPDSNGEETTVHLSFTGFPLIASCFSELCRLSETQSILIGTLDYMSDTLKQISEGWETILLEMDNKLHTYAKQMPDHHGMAADFLELLMLGTPSPELENFLLQELGEKGLKKLGHSIEVSYSNMQRLVLKYLHTVSQAVNFHLAEIIGHVRASDKYESVLKFSEDAIKQAQTKASIFWAKGIELQQVIDESMKCFKAFFRWLYVEILRLSDETVSEELSKASQQDVEFISEFLNSFSRAADNDSYTYLERVGQYLKNENLAQPVDRSKNPWFAFLKEHPDLKEIPEILIVDENSSLVQAFDSLKTSIIEAFAALDCDLTGNCQTQGSARIQGNSGSIITSIEQSETPEVDDKIYAHILWTTVNSAQNRPAEAKINFFEFEPANMVDQKSSHLKGLSLTGGIYNNSDFHLVKESFYTTDTISVLVTSIEGHRLIQLPISPMEHYMTNIDLSVHKTTDLRLDDMHLKTLSIFSIAGPACQRQLEGLNSDMFAVSGPRKVVAFLFKNRKRIRIYDMVEEEEDDEDDTLGNSGISSELNTSF